MALLSCPCCGKKEFNDVKILWPELIKTWELSREEATYINRQQGIVCTNCHSNLRSMTLAKAIMSCYGAQSTTLQEFLKTNGRLRILEVNEAGNLNPFFEGMRNHALVNYPEVDIQKLPYRDEYFDLVIHSDTLEHVKDPVKALKESYRVLKKGGFTCYTIPTVIGRLSKRRDGLKPSHHGSPGNNEYLVYTEYGSDMWTQLFEGGFEEIKLVSLEFPSSVALVGVKLPTRNKLLRGMAQNIATKLRNKSGSEAKLQI